jgi:hypothetical protein
MSLTPPIPPTLRLELIADVTVPILLGTPVPPTELTPVG